MFRVPPGAVHIASYHLPLVLLPILSFLSCCVSVLFPESCQLYFQAVGESLIARLSAEVVQLIGVFQQIVEFPCVNVMIEMYELVSVSADAVMPLHAVFGRILVEMII